VRIRIVISLVLALTVVGAETPSDADSPTFRVIVHPDNPTTRLDRKFVADAFLKKRTRWGDDTVIRPVDLGARSSVRAKFSSDVVGRSVAAIRRYWSQLVFSGRGVPPPEVNSDDAVIKYVTRYPGAIGYISGTADIDGAKVVQVR
jgi:ABC-type phosphate transport system substrate-binding protein